MRFAHLARAVTVVSSCCLAQDPAARARRPLWSGPVRYISLVEIEIEIEPPGFMVELGREPTEQQGRTRVDDGLPPEIQAGSVEALLMPTMVSGPEVVV